MSQVHICGRFHCEEGLGIPEHLPSYAPTRTGATGTGSGGLRAVTVVCVEQGEAAALGPAGLVRLADFVVVTSPAAQLPLSHPV